MPRMTFDLKGYMTCGAHEVAELVKQGWRIISDEEFNLVLDKKRAPKKSDTIAPSVASTPSETSTSAALPTRKQYSKSSILNENGEK